MRNHFTDVDLISRFSFIVFIGFMDEEHIRMLSIYCFYEHFARHIAMLNRNVPNGNILYNINDLSITIIAIKVRLGFSDCGEALGYVTYLSD